MITLALVGYFLLKPVVKPVQQAILPATHKTQTPLPKVVYRGLPVRLQIPSINVDTTIEYTGLTKTGDMTAPTGVNSAGWYKYGAIPGETGSAVMDGHVVGPKGEPAVFANLNKLKPGDQLLVVDAKAQTATFVVREVRTYSETQQHDAVFNSSGGTHLNIITCAGEWDSSQRHYVDRFVVFADKVSS